MYQKDTWIYWDKNHNLQQRVSLFLWDQVYDLNIILYNFLFVRISY